MKFQVLVLLLIFGASAIQWVIKNLKEQAAKKRAADERQRMEEEALRTGRSATADSAARLENVAARRMPAADPEEARLAELARRRQELVAELRRRAAAKQGGGGAGASGVGAPSGLPRTMPSRGTTATVRPAMTASGGLTQSGEVRGVGPGNAVVPGPRVPGRPVEPVASRPVQRGAQRPAPARPAPKPRPAVMEEEERRVPLVAPMAAEGVVASPRGASRGVPVFRAGMRPEELRRAIVLQEVLGPPASMR